MSDLSTTIISEENAPIVDDGDAQPENEFADAVAEEGDVQGEFPVTEEILEGGSGAPQDFETAGQDGETRVDGVESIALYQLETADYQSQAGSSQANEEEYLRLEETYESPSGASGEPSGMNKRQRHEQAGSEASDEEAKRRRGNTSSCYRCGGQGHIAKFCSSETGAINGPGPECFKCHGKGHIVARCPNHVLTAFLCFKCGLPGHRSRECMNPSGMGGMGYGGRGGMMGYGMSGGPNSAGGYGAPGYPMMGGMPGAVPMPGYFVGGRGGGMPYAGGYSQMMGGGPNYQGGSGRGGSAAESICFRCNQTGHFARECSLPQGPKSCHKCGQEGHLARDCTKTVCFTCRQPGHVSRDCTQASSYGGPGSSGYQGSSYGGAYGASSY